MKILFCATRRRIQIQLMEEINNLISYRLFQGVYNVNDLMVDNEELPINGANVGRYEICMNLYKLNNPDDPQGDKKLMGGVCLNCVIEPM